MVVLCFTKDLGNGTTNIATSSNIIEAMSPEEAFGKAFNNAVDYKEHVLNHQTILDISGELQARRK